jgi:hypothetical protein
MDGDVKVQVSKLGLPPAVATALGACCEDLVRAGGPALQGLLLYGSAARGRYRPGGSDVNVVVVLREASPEALDRLAPALQRGRRSVALEPFLITADEVPRAADVFPTKFQDIAAHHVLLHGEDPFSALVVPHAHLRLRVEQELRNLCHRLRRTYVGVRGDPQRLAAVLVDAVPGASVEFAALLRLLDHAPPTEDTPQAVLRAVAPVLGLQPAALAAVAQPSAEEALAAAHLLMDALARAAERADTAEERAAG